MGRLFMLAAGSTAAALAVGACGSSYSSSAAMSSQVTPAAAKAKPGRATLAVASTPLGAHLTDGSGRTLYLFLHDLRGKSRCAGQCASAWPPLHTRGKPAHRKGVRASLISTTKRGDGTTQVVYAGHPLYRFSGDTSPGQANGEGINHFGGRWYMVSPAGTALVKGAKPKAKAQPAPATTPSSGGGYGGY
jgi:predicted lipoprotein with Yx(FWY)xxD motif